MCHRDGRSLLRKYFHYTARSSVLLSLAFVVAGCASIDRFAVTPRSVCRGDTVTAAWSANGDVRLLSQPTLKGTGAQPATGKQAFAVKQPTRFTLIATRAFGSQTAAADVAVAPAERGYGAVAQCIASERLIRARLQLDNQTSGQLQVETVSNPLDRLLRVSKGSHTARIAPDAQSAAFRGMPVRGAWQLASPLKAGETCTSAMRGLRQRLQMHVTLQCGD